MLETHPYIQEDIQNQFRKLSREILHTAHDPAVHMKRIDIATDFKSNEPLQGALADYFYGCWFAINDNSHQTLNLIENIKYRLPPHVYQTLTHCVNNNIYIERITDIATSWSVLTIPSMDVPLHKLRTSKDNTWFIVETVINQLNIAKQHENIERIAEIEQDFFDHCLICSDLMAFMKVWFKLHRSGWNLDERWKHCKDELEKHAH